MVHLTIPFLKPPAIEDAVQGLLHQFAAWAKAEVKPPIPIENILENHLKLDFEVTDLKSVLGKDDVLGAAWFEKGKVAVDSSIEREEGRLAFTLGHEAGHWILHRPLWEQQRRLSALLPAEKEEPAFICRESERRGEAEWQANQFSSRLLMPTGFVREAVTAAFGSKRPSWPGLRSKANRDEYDPELKRVAAAVIREGHFTNVSNEAMRRRLLELKLVEDAAEVQRNLFT